jgi:hypothetical protein
MKVPEEDARYMSDAGLDQALEARRAYGRKLAKREDVAEGACIALMLVGLAAGFFLASGAAVYGAVAAFAGYLTCQGAGAYSIEKNEIAIRKLEGEAVSRSYGHRRGGGRVFTSSRLTQLFTASAPAKPKCSPKIPKLLPIKITPITNWN